MGKREVERDETAERVRHQRDPAGSLIQGEVWVVDDAVEVSDQARDSDY